MRENRRITQRLKKDFAHEKAADQAAFFITFLSI